MGPAEEHRVLGRVRRSGTTAGAMARIRPERRSAARRPQRSHRLKRWAKPLPGCSRRCSRIRRCRARLPGRCRAGRNAHANDRGQDDQDGQGDDVLEDHEGSPLRADRTALRRAARAAPGFRPTDGGQGGADRGDAIQRDGGERPVPFGDQGKEPGRSWSPSAGPSPARARPGPGRWRGAAAGGDRAFLEHPGAEPGQGRDRRQGQAQQPQDQAAEDGQRGGRVGGQPGAGGPGADDRR